MLRKWEIDWFYQQGASTLFPDRWEQYLAPIPRRERGDLLRAYHRRLTGRSRARQLEAARAWSIWEAATSFLRADERQMREWGDAGFATAIARIECHYFVNKGFLQREDQLLRGVRRIRHIPAVIVQGRYDVVCPMQTAWDLHRAWPEADFRVVADAGHSALEPGITHELVTATDRFARAERPRRGDRSLRRGLRLDESRADEDWREETELRADLARGVAWRVADIAGQGTPQRSRGPTD